jgi:hypothetical protein
MMLRTSTGGVWVLADDVALWGIAADNVRLPAC